MSPALARAPGGGPARWLAVASLLAATGGTWAGSVSMRYCDRPAALSARQQDRLLRLASAARDELEASGARAALIARTGTDLSRFGIRYSHAGLTLRDHPDAPWTVRQLYYACDEGRPLLFDQGVAGFLLGTDDPSIGYVSIVTLPDAAAQPVARAALDRPLALTLLGGTYSANAYGWSTRYQNCNQWVAELLAAAWSGLQPGGAAREHAQQWLASAGYAPQPVDVGSHLWMIAGMFVPFLHTDDHPEDDRYALRLRISLPASLEAFVHAREPAAGRIELCHDARHIVVHRGWTPLADGCEPGAGDRVIALD